jgi:HlyD family secretion protein
MQEMQNITAYKSSEWKWKIISALFVLSLGTLSYFFFVQQDKKGDYRYITQQLSKGDLVLSVFATGYLQPLESVDVGTEVSGTIKEVYLDYNDLVKQGQPLARLDKTKYQSLADKAVASMAASEASLQNAKAQLNRAKAIMDRDEILKASTKGILPSQDDFEGDLASYLAAKAQVANAAAQVDQAKHTLVSAKYDLEKTVVYSPIDGIVLVRNIDPGQTVAASFQTPVLFTIAKDLTKMELHVSIDEADVAKIKTGQKAIFSVDAHPQTVFEATIKKVHVNSEIQDGVVTYTTVMDVDNHKFLLKPGMSVDADIITETIKDGFILPRAALIYTPIEVKEKEGFALFGDRGKLSAVDQKPHIWVLKNNQANKVYVKLLGSSGSTVAVESETLKVGDTVVLAQEKKE